MGPITRSRHPTYRVRRRLLRSEADPAAHRPVRPLPALPTEGHAAMKFSPPLRLPLPAILFAALLAMLFAATGSAAPNLGSGTILVKFRPGTSAATEAAIHRNNGGSVVGEIAQLGVQIVRVAGNAGDHAKAYGRNASVAYAEPDASAHAADVPNDPSLSTQWGLAKVGATAAWSVTHGSSSVRIAVLDTGVSLSHPDLASKIVASQNFSSSTTVDDVNGHGSHVAGIAAAVTNNGVGVAGLAYNAQIENVKVLGDDGSGSYSAISQGITWAADNGANVINLSLTGSTASSTLQSAVDYAWSKGAVVVAAAGNNANSTPVYPAYYTNAIAVAATTDLDQLAVFSNYGSWVDVAAPGISIYSTIPGGYGYKSGTSMASPYVAGLAALLFSRLTDTNGNGRLNDEVRAQIQATSDNIGLTGIGSGRIDAYRAVTEVSGTPTSGTLAGKVTDASTGAAVVGATVSDGVASAVTDVNGAYAMANVTARSYTVSASASGYTTGAQSASVSSGQTATVNFALSKPVASGTISGVVTDAATGIAIAGATVSDGSASAVTDATGAYTIANVAAGSYTVNASALSYSSGSQSVSVTSGKTVAASFALVTPPAAPSTTMWISGITFKSTGPNLRVGATVTSSAGAAVPGAQVQLSVTCNGATWTFNGITDSTGAVSFAIQKAPKGTYTAAVTTLSG
jgi:thermitase